MECLVCLNIKMPQHLRRIVTNGISKEALQLLVKVSGMMKCKMHVGQRRVLGWIVQRRGSVR
jgi:hypothetical protein